MPSRKSALKVAEKGRLPPLDPLEALRETARNAQEGNRKLALSVDALRDGLETIAQAEMDNQTGLPVSAADLRKLAVNTLDTYSRLTGQNWRRNRIVTSRAGDRSLGGLDE